MTLQEVIAAIQKNFADSKYDRFIHRVCFPSFKNFKPGAIIDFNFPLTAVVGPNGGGKSSLLHAAWGMPLKHSTSRFWFSTPVDPIDYDKNDRPRYWYSHYVAQMGAQVQTRKIVGNKRHGYWEPSRIAMKEGMEPMPAMNEKNGPFMSPKGDRWTPVARTPLYFNGKTDASAFDRFFTRPGTSTLEQKQDKFVKYSRHLKRVIDESLSSFEYYGIERVDKNFMLTSQQLAAVNRILAKKYVSARYVIHKFYDSSAFSPSVIFETAELNYSECFAGSGELAVVNLVLALEDVKTYDLVLLDEPETSLHPGAQQRLVEYLLKLSRDRFLQVIIATHSQTIVNLLPNSALIVLDETSEGIHARVAPTKKSAFHRLGVTATKDIAILAEDQLMKVFVERALKKLDPDITRDVTVIADDVGASEMLSNQVRAFARAKSKTIMVLDGDQKCIADIFSLDPKSLSAARKAELIKELKNLNISIVGTGPHNYEEDLEEWMEWCRDHVIVIDEVCAEQVFLSTLKHDHPLLTSENATNPKFKSAVKKLLRDGGNEQSPAGQATIFKLKLGEVQQGSPPDKSLVSLSKRLGSILARLDG